MAGSRPAGAFQINTKTQRRKGTKAQRKAASRILFSGLSLCLCVSVSLCLFQCLQDCPLLIHALPTILGEALHASEYRLRIQMRFGDHIRFETSSEPLIVPVGCERVFIGL